MTESDTESDDWGPPRNLVERFLRNEESLRRILDEVHENQMLGEYGAAREQLRSLAGEENQVFQVAVFTVLEMEQFYEDLKEQYEAESPPIEDLKSFGDRYRDLASELELVFTESTYSYYNPSPSITRGLRYSDSVNIPRLALEVYSGETRLCEFEHPPSQALILAGSVVDAVADLFETVDEHDDEIAPKELDRTESVIQQLVSDVERVTDQVDEFEDQSTSNSDKNSEGYDEYQDWGIY